ncbi:MAG: DUF6206 family protein [Acidimicrobiia bacterium]|nr:DUF6206 family protein [Acidimicrobiia bacterium]
MITDAELAALEDEVQLALASGDRSGLDLRGFGVTSVVLAAPVEAPRVACKRVPPFEDRAAFDRYREVVMRNIDEFRAAGVDVVDTDVRLIEHGGRLVGFVVQPLLDTATLAEAVLKDAEPTATHPLVVAIVDHVLNATTDRRGLDAQVGNWAVVDGRVFYLDVTTPFLFDQHGDLVMDLDVFLEAGPPVLRPIYRRQLPATMKRWTDPRHALLDLAGNLYKLDLDAWVEPIIAATAGRVDPPLTVAEARQYYGGEVATWSMLHRALRGYEWWQRRVRRTTPNAFVPPPDYDPGAWKEKQRSWA